MACIVTGYDGPRYPGGSGPVYGRRAPGRGRPPTQARGIPLLRNAPSWIVVLAAFATLGGSAACSSEAASRLAGNGAGVPVTLRLASVSSTATSTNSATLPASSFAGPLTGDFSGSRGFGDFGDGMGHHWRGWWGWMRTNDVDSLVVDVTKVEVLAMLPDTEDAADSVADTATAARFGHRDDDDSSGWQEHEWGWIQLDVTDGGHVDLTHLPDTSGTGTNAPGGVVPPGIAVATGTLPAGTYRHVRLFVTNPMIYFDTTLVTPAGDTLQANLGYAVTIPCADSTGAAIRTDDPFVVPDGGGTVQLYFDRDDTVRHIIITGDGKIIVPPVIR
jgi:hypothetical protein